MKSALPRHMQKIMIFFFVNPNVIHKSLEVSALSRICSACSCLYHTAFLTQIVKTNSRVEQDVVNRHRKEIIELMDIYRYSRSENRLISLG